jgi:hypothetical protein
MRRWHEDYPRTLREWKRHDLLHVEFNVGSNREIGRDPYQIDCVCDVQRGRFRKGRAYGSKRPRSRWFRRRGEARQELLAELRLREWLRDVGLWG